MNFGSPKEPVTMAAYPKSLHSIAASVGGLALFLIFASLLLVSGPIGSTVRGYFYDVDSSSKFDNSFINETVIDSKPYENVVKDIITSNASTLSGNQPMVGSTSNLKKESREDAVGGNQYSESQDREKISNSRVSGSSSSPPVVSETKKEANQPVAMAQPSQEGNTTGITLPPNNTKGFEKAEYSIPDLEAVPPLSPIASNASQTGSVNSGDLVSCDLLDGKWVYDSAGPLYLNNSCPVLTQMQNCQGNGRPDKDYENWRWKPARCDLPRFDARKFLELMRGKTLAYIGDSVARNQMESMLCILWQVEVPTNRGNRRMQRYYFKSTSTMIVRIWSSWLVHRTSEKFDFAPEGVDKLHLDAPDETFMEFIPKFDVLVLSSGHWFAKQSVYILNNEIVGGQLWWPDNSRPKKIDNIEAFGISVETILTALGTHPNYTGLTIVRSYSPDHYEGGAWNTGGSCTGKVKPASDGEFVENGFTNIMHEKQVAGFNRAINKKTNKSKLRLMDITKAFGYRHDGHPGPYRSPDPNKITKRGPDGRPPPQDCLHWCMPGPVDTWNELVFEIIRRDFEGSQSSAS